MNINKTSDGDGVGVTKPITYGLLVCATCRNRMYYHLSKEALTCSHPAFEEFRWVQEVQAVLLNHKNEIQFYP